MREVHPTDYQLWIFLHPNGLSLRLMDQCQMLCKKHGNKFFQNGFLRDYEHAGTPELEVYSSDDPSSPNLYSELWILVK